MENNSFRFKIGQFNCLAIRDGDDFNRNVLLVDTGQHHVLIETGVGQDLYPTPALLLDRLRAAGSLPTEIDVVMLSHADWDHIGGTVDKSGSLAFPNARYVLPRAEWDFWSSKPVRLPQMMDANFRQGYSYKYKIPQTRLTQLRDKVELIDPDTQIVPGIRSIAAPGHTPGHAVIAVSSDDNRMLFLGDLIHDPKDIEDPNWSSNHDFDPVQGVATRQRLLAQAARERTLLMAYHAPFPGLGYVASHGAGWRWAALQQSDEAQNSPKSLEQGHKP
jgi:glyoxylase-like metal-dependent hydrolase (beta-lactamase superfamily II)